MIRPILTELALFLAPFAAYAIFLLVTKTAVLERSSWPPKTLAGLAIGALFVPLGGIHAAWQGAALLAVVGLLGGSMQVAILTWLQRRVPQAMIGRAMSLFMFIFMGLVPMASAVTGWVMKWVALPQLFAACGALLAGTALVAAVASPMRRVIDPAAPLPQGR